MSLNKKTNGRIAYCLPRLHLTLTALRWAGESSTSAKTEAEQRIKTKNNNVLLNKVMSDETKVEETTNADGDSVSQPIAKPHVVGSQMNSIFLVQAKPI